MTGTATTRSLRPSERQRSHSIHLRRKSSSRSFAALRTIPERFSKPFGYYFKTCNLLPIFALQLKHEEVFTPPALAYIHLHFRPSYPGGGNAFIQIPHEPFPDHPRSELAAGRESP